MKNRLGESWCQNHLADQQLYQLLEKVDADTFPASITFEVTASVTPDGELAHFVRAHDSDREKYSLSELIQKHAIQVPHANLRPDRWQLEEGEASQLLDRLMTTGRLLE